MLVVTVNCSHKLKLQIGIFLLMDDDITHGWMKVKKDKIWVLVIWVKTKNQIMKVLLVPKIERK